MPHGTPDWGLVGPKETVHGLDDLAEHAVRLGSPVLWDRRGDVIWQTDFRDGIDGIEWYVSAGAPVHTLFAGNSRQGAYCIYLQGGGEEGDEYVGLLKRLPFPVSSRIGLEFSCNVYIEYAYLKCELYMRNRGNLYYGQLRFDTANETLDYLDDAGGWPDTGIGTAPDYRTAINHTIKLVVDLDAVDAAGAPAPEYVRAMFDHETYTFPPGTLLPMGGGGTPLLEARIWFENFEETVADAYIDSVIVTQNEP